MIEKQKIFDTNRTLIGRLDSEEFNKDNPAFTAQFIKGSKQSLVSTGPFIPNPVLHGVSLAIFVLLTLELYFRTRMLCFGTPHIL